TVTQNFTLALLPQVTVTGRIVGSDAPTVGIEGATISLTGYEPYTATTNATGNFTITDVFASQTYNYVAQATGYQPAIGEVVVGTTNVNMGDITVNEMAFPPYGVVAAENATFTQVNLEWQAPNPGATGMTEGFEDATFPPTNWTQVITDTSAPGTTGVAPTWCRVGEVALTPAVPAHGGDWQAATWWSYNHQDEWLITPQFTCPPSADLDFWSYVYFGSTNGDHYYVKVSTDNGSTWTTLWDASTETGGWNYYATPITIPLAAYSGQQIKIAWHAEDPPSNDGLWYVWFLDDITIGTPTQVLQFPMDQFTTRSAAQSNELAQNKVYPSLPTSRAMVNNPRLQEPSLQVVQPSNPDRTLLGYRVWRLLAADQANEANWTQLTPANITPTNYTDTAWGPLPSGVYKYAVKAVYTNSVMSNAAFSNELHKGMMGVLTGTVTEFGTAVPIAGATVTAGEYSGTSNAQGVYNISIYAGTYNVACAKTGYQTATQNNVVITGLQTTTQNFVLTEITLPAAAVQAEIAGNNVNVTWMAPGTAGGEWIHYDSGENNDSIGLTSGGEFSAAIRFPASALSDYAGMSLYAISIYPGDLATYSLRVWTGGTPTAPGTQVVNQPFTVPTADVFQTVLLDNPVTVTGSEELWFGFNVTHTAGLYPAGCDDGPALNGFGNMIYNAGEWSTLYDLASALNYNWNIQGYVGYSAPTSMNDLVPLTLKGLAHPAKSLAPETTTSDRSLVGYNVWRLLQGQEGNEAAWTALTTNPQTATAYQDTNWGTLPDGWYKWAVKAIYTGGAAAQAAFSNAIQRQTEIGTIAGIVRNMANQAIPGATVPAGGVNATTNANGAYSMQVSAGTYTVTATAPGYGAATQPGVVVVTGQTTTVNFQLPASTILLEDGFESYANFVIEFAPWTLLDVDQSTTYGITDHTWDNDYDAQAFIIFNPTATSPAMAAGAEPHAGDKYAACFAATTPDNNDWMIAPLLAGGGEISFWARSYVSTYGLERFKVGVSTTGTNPNDFTFISGTGYIEAPVEWTQYTYDLAAYDDQQIRIGINCVSHDAFFFMVDDVEVTGTGAGEDDLAPVVATKLFNNYPNPFNPETTIRFSVKEASPVTIEIYNVKGQRVRTLVNETKASGNYDVTWNGKDNHGRNVSSGIYYYKMNAGKFSSTKKMILMK
ncbi:MAG: choice-of-anchor J domain-containing protein, partial [Candidatus Cloacimonetes bacterium]|nr:choice-of-anchor J domain-containing protein [Candidatus Cloacimonadota bacterium]